MNFERYKRCEVFEFYQRRRISPGAATDRLALLFIRKRLEMPNSYLGVVRTLRSAWQ